MLGSSCTAASRVPTQASPRGEARLRRVAIPELARADDPGTQCVVATREHEGCHRPIDQVTCISLRTYGAMCHREQLDLA